MMFNLQMSGQLLRYGMTGLLTNAVAYSLYLVLALNGLGILTAMTLAFITGTCISFSLNRSWTFRRSDDKGLKMKARFLVCILTAYLVNASLLWYLVDLKKLPHELVQACLIAVIAIGLFLAQRYWVFPRVSETRESIHCSKLP